MDLKQFLTSPLRNVWISEPYIRVYVRKSIRLIDNIQRDCLDIGSVEVEPHKRNKGVFSKFLLKFEKTAKQLNRVVYVENVLNPRLEEMLERREYRYLGNFPGAPTMYKEIN